MNIDSFVVNLVIQNGSNNVSLEDTCIFFILHDTLCIYLFILYIQDMYHVPNIGMLHLRV